MRVLLVLSLLAGLVCALMPRDGLCAGVPSAMQRRYEAMASFSAEFTQVLTHKESGSVEKRRGTLLFSKPLRIRWETAKPHAETLVVTDREIWDYLPDEEVAYRYPLDLVRDSRSVIQVFTGQAALTRDFDVKDLGREDGLVKLRIYPKEPTPQLVEASLWVEPESGLIRRATIVDFYGNTNALHFVRFTPDAPAPAASFGFRPPAGVEVEDRVGSKVQERELFR